MTQGDDDKRVKVKMRWHTICVWTTFFPGSFAEGAVIPCGV